MKKEDILYLIWIKTRVHCLAKVGKKYGYDSFDSIIKELDIDLFDQYTGSDASEQDEKQKKYYELNLINQHAFQASFTARVIKKTEWNKNGTPLVLVDIGDSAGSHIKYVKKLLSDYFYDIHAVSVNLDPIAVEKIRKRGGEAILCRAEDYKPEGLNVDVYLSYEMVEHLHNPAIFFYRLAKCENGRYMVVTVPYRTQSRVALGNTMNCSADISAEQEHIFELSPEDWKKLIWHAGWRVIDEEIYYQYPRNSILAPIYSLAWNQCDFEGFYAMFLERDMTAANRYKDWED